MKEHEPVDLSNVYNAGIEVLGDVDLSKASWDKWKRSGHLIQRNI